LSEQRKRAKHKKEQAKHKKLQEYEKKREKEELEKLRAKREQEKKQIKERKKRDEEEKAKEENLRQAKEENERKDFEAREKLKKESEFERKSKVVELKSNSTSRELIVRNLVCNPSPIPFMKTQVPKGVFPSLISSHFFINSLVLFPSQTFFSLSHSLISSLSYSAKINFDFKILFNNHPSQSVKHSFCEVGLIPTFSKFISPLSHILQSIILHGLHDFNPILFNDYYRYVFDPGGTQL